MTSWLSSNSVAILSVALLILLVLAIIQSLQERQRAAPLPKIRVPNKRVAKRDPQTGELVPIYDSRLSLAVLMFEPLSSGEENEVFASGISSEIIGHVTSVPDIRVNSRPSTYAFRTGAVNFETVAESLNARYILSGTVELGGDKIQVEAKLHDMEIGRVIWSQYYDQDLDEMFEVQRDIARRIVGAVMGQVRLAETLFALASEDQQLDAWGLVNKAYYFWLTKFKAEALFEACNYLREAIEIDPNYSRARAALAMLLAQQMTTRICKDYDLCCEAASELIEKAYASAPNDIEVLENAGVTWQNLGESDKAIGALRKAVSLAPLNLIARGYLALALSFTRGKKGALEARQLIIDNFATAPKHPSAAYWNYFLAVAEAQLGNNDVVIELTLKSLKRQPAWIHSYYLLANAYCNNGQYDLGRETVLKAAEISPYLTVSLYAENVYKIVGDRERSKPFVEGLQAANLVPAL